MEHLLRIVVKRRATTAWSKVGSAAASLRAARWRVNRNHGGGSQALAFSRHSRIFTAHGSQVH